MNKTEKGEINVRFEIVQLNIKLKQAKKEKAEKITLIYNIHQGIIKDFPSELSSLIGNLSAQIK